MSAREPGTNARLACLLALGAFLGQVGCSQAVEPPRSESASATASSGSDAVREQVVTDIEHWQHPTKAVFAKYHVALQKVTIKEKFATFAVEFPFDPQTEPNAANLKELCLELLKANGSWSYALVSIQDRLEIDVSWDKQARRISIENHAI